jgi:hypothetical protein
MKSLTIVLFFLTLGTAAASESLSNPASDSAQPQSVKYKKSKDVDFEELLIQGALKRPEITVVTGDTGQNGDGLLKLRENFLDRMTADAGEAAQ